MGYRCVCNYLSIVECK